MMEYPQIPGTLPFLRSVLPPTLIDEIPQDLTSPKLPEIGSKSIFAFWHSGIHSIPPYRLRNVLAWHRRFSPLGWTIYVLDTVPGSQLDVSNFIDTTSPSVVPSAFTEGTLDGNYASQHTSDLIRFPLLLKYGGNLPRRWYLAVRRFGLALDQTYHQPGFPLRVCWFHNG